VGALDKEEAQCTEKVPGSGWGWLPRMGKRTGGDAGEQDLVGRSSIASRG
jgi:hypothetical protein